jgi:hypothetical protein
MVAVTDVGSVIFTVVVVVQLLASVTVTVHEPCVNVEAVEVV